ncbi:hypothetical protein PI87_16425 [Ralstonia sp. A12]|uniref:hypothetical protein n=1 Tax=Ralstonia sp. A12 TaxID=1217052 RepID=UPI0005741BF7|nr:hypothetical protein [Ralstonia sp. A12]KHK54103.1 hypothetical protein PI87_16425 [Ralstonia sp. A12]
MKNQRDVIAQLPTQLIAKRIREEDSKVLRREAVTPLDQYQHAVVQFGDWIIREQPVLMLPRELTEFLSLDLRDQGNDLIEETRQLNNQFVGRSMRTVTALLIADIELLDLSERVLLWTESVIRQVVYRCRRRIQNNPFETYIDLFDAFVRDIDTRIAHGDDRMYQRVWSDAIDCMVYLLIEACFLKSGYAALIHEDEPPHYPRLVGTVVSNPDHEEAISRDINLFGVEPVQYINEIIARPLTNFLEAEGYAESRDDLLDRFHGYVGDLLEASPYLCASGRASRYMFAIPGTACWAAFRFIASHGFGVFFFSDSEEDMRRDLETNAFRGAINVGFDGSFSYMMHPWLTLGRALGSDAALSIACWMLEQIHARVVDDYLKVGVGGPKARTGESELAVTSDEPDSDQLVANEIAIYASWVREAQAEDELASDLTPTVDRDSHIDPAAAKTRLPQIRRSRFFKLLRACDVEIVQGKGSEKKLLRGGAHPFRLGSHYGPNPTIPSFLAGQILRRLNITHEEWMSAIVSVKAIKA